MLRMLLIKCRTISHREGGGAGEGDSWEFLVGHPVLQILTLFQTKKCHFSHLFSAPTSKKLWRHSLNKNASSHISSFLVHLELNDKNVHTPTSRKLYLFPDLNGQNLYPFSDQHGAKSIPFWDGTYLYGSHKGEPPGSVKWPIQLVFPSFLGTF